MTSRCCSKPATAATISQWNMFYQPGVTPRHHQHHRRGHRPVVRLGDAVSRPSRTRATATRSARRCRTSPARTTSRPGSRTSCRSRARYYQSNGNMNYTFRNGAADLDHAARHAVPRRRRGPSTTSGFYAQDQWTLEPAPDAESRPAHGTCSTATRRSSRPASRATAEGFPGALDARTSGSRQRTFAPVNNIPNWKDWSPRMGVSYDLFGNGQTAIKAQLGTLRLQAGHRPHRRPESDCDLGRSRRPATGTTSRIRLATRGAAISCPTAISGTSLINGECGAISNNNFGKNNPNATRWDPAVLEGYGKRDSNWDFSTEIQHELRPGFGVTGGYYYNNGGYTRQAGSRRARHRQPARQPGGLRPVLHHGADECAACRAAAGTKSAVWPTSSRTVRAGSEPRDGARAVRRIREPQRLLQRRDRRPRWPTASGSAAASTPAARWPATASSSTARRTC